MGSAEKSLVSPSGATTVAWPGLEGLRGIAAFVVVLSHTSKKVPPLLDWSGAGKIGVWLFFTLSAFILTYQMLVTGAPFRPDTLLRYHVRRFFRIYPMFVIGLCAWLALGLLAPSRMLPALMLQHAPDHFWTVPVEYQYYLLVPVVAWFFLSVLRGSLPALIFAIAIASLAAIILPLPAVMVWRFLPVFLAGSFGACLLNRLGDTPGPLRNAGFWGLVCALVACLAIPGVMRTLGIDALVDVDVPRNRHELYGWLFLPVIFAAISDRCWRRVLGFPLLRFLGGLSFSLYLLHPVAIDLVAEIALPVAPSVNGALCILASIAVAAIAQAAIERPMRLLGYRLSSTRPQRPCGTWT